MLVNLHERHRDSRQCARSTLRHAALAHRRLRGGQPDHGRRRLHSSATTSRRCSAALADRRPARLPDRGGDRPTGRAPRQRRRQMAAGSFDAPLNDRRLDEIGDLARALESMRASLKESFGVLTADRNKLEAIFDGLTDAVIVVDFEGPVRFSNSAAADLLDNGRPAPGSAAAAAAPRRRGRLLRPPGDADRRPRLRDAGPLAARRARRARRRPRPHRRDAARVRRSRLRLQRRPRAAQPAGRDLRRDRGAAGRRQGRPQGRRTTSSNGSPKTPSG